MRRKESNQTKLAALFMFLISSWSLFQVQRYLPLSIINNGISKHYAGSQVSDRCPLGYFFSLLWVQYAYSGFFTKLTSSAVTRIEVSSGWRKSLILKKVLFGKRCCKDSSGKMTLCNHCSLIHLYLLDPSGVVITLTFQVWVSTPPWCSSRW